LKAVIEYEPGTFLKKVYLYAPGPEGTAVFNLDGTVRETLPLNVRPEPSALIEDEVLKALMAEASDVLPPSSALAHHLDDAIGVRDRLLTLVEGSR
jgi:hypothetical protein